MKIVADSSPLIGFAILDRLDLLTLIFSEIYIPQAVLAEVSIWDKPYSPELKAFSMNRLKYVRDRVKVRKLIMGKPKRLPYVWKTESETFFWTIPKGGKSPEARDYALSAQSAFCWRQRNQAISAI